MNMPVCEHAFTYVYKWLHEIFKIHAKPALFYDQFYNLESHHLSLGEFNKISFRGFWLPFVLLPLL